MLKIAELDSFDHALLERLRVNNRAPARVLAEQVGLSESAVLRRMRDLRKGGAIVADVSVIHPAVFGTSLTIHVLVTLEREGAQALEVFEKKLATRREVQGIWYVTGEADYVVLLRVAVMKDFVRFADEVLNGDPNVKAFRTIVALKEVAVGRSSGPRSAGKR